MRNKELSRKEVEKRVVILYCRGKIIREISSLIGINERKVSFILNKYCKPKRNSTKSIKLKNKICSLYKKTDVSASVLARYLQIEKKVVYRTLRKNNINLRKKKMPKTPPTHNNRTYTINPYYFDNIDTDEKAYWLGFLAADGCVTKDYPEQRRGPYLKIALSLKDEKHIVKFLKSINANNEIKRVRSNNTSIVNINCRHMVNSLEKHGIVNKKTLTYSFPRIERKFVPHFIRGYFDGDGCISYSKQTSGYPVASVTILGTEEMLKTLQNYLFEDIHINKTKLIIPHKDRDNGITRVFSSGGRNNVKKIFDYMYENSTLHMDRKYTKFAKYFQADAEYKSR